MQTLADTTRVNPATGCVDVSSGWDNPLVVGSTRGLFGAAGEVLASVGYAPYGAPAHANAGAAPAFTYTGKPLDTVTGLYHFPYRQHDPNASRWLTRDPLGMVDGPNVYSYVGGKVSGYRDDLGLSRRDTIKCVSMMGLCAVAMAMCLATKHPLVCLSAIFICMAALEACEDVTIGCRRCYECPPGRRMSNRGTRGCRCIRPASVVGEPSSIRCIQVPCEKD